MKKRGSTSTYQPRKQRKSNGLKACNLGKNCPYQHEYQHKLEFSHDSDGNGIENTRKSDVVEKFKASSGMKLGGGTLNGYGTSRLLHEEQTVVRETTATNSSSASNKDDSKLNSKGVKLGNESGDVQSKNFFRPRTSLSSESTNVTPTATDSCKFCELCFEFVPVHEFPGHLAGHGRSAAVDSLRREQDAQYEDSVVADLQRAEEERLMRLQAENERLLLEEENALKEALEASRKLAAEDEKRNALAALVDEPDCVSYAGRIVQLRFCFPCGAKVIRRFRADSSVQNAFQFLRTLPQHHTSLLAASSCALKHTFGTDTIRDSETCTFSALGIATNCTLLVVYSDASEHEEASCGSDISGSVAMKTPVAAVPAVPTAAKQIGDSKENKSGNSHVSSVEASSTAVAKSVGNSSGLLGAVPEVIDLTT